MSADDIDMENLPLEVVSPHQDDSIDGTGTINDGFCHDENANKTTDKSLDIEVSDVAEGPMPHRRRAYVVTYGVNDRPPWYTSILLGFQHFLTMFGSTVFLPILLAPSLCVGNDILLLSQLIGTIFFVSGLITIIQSTFGVRLAIIQGGTSVFLAPTFAILSLKGDCPPPITVNSTQAEKNNATEAFQIRMTEIQGTIMTAACIQVVIGFTGIIGWLLNFIGPLTTAPTIALIGFSVYDSAADRAGLHWGIATMTIVLILGFSQYMSNVSIPFCGRDDVTGKWTWNKKVQIFKLFPIIFGILTAWLISYILTITNVFTSNPDRYGYAARTDLNTDVLNEAAWFRFPYPGQWGRPTVSVASTLGMMAAVIASMIESVGDYYACARLSGAPPPPAHAINRGIGIEGIGSILAGAWGSGSGTTSYSQNIGAIGITKVGSRLVIQIAGCMMIIMGIVNKCSALFATIPDPIVGGVLCVLFGMVASVGLSNLQFVDLNSTRNMCVLGFSLFMGLVLPYWIDKNPEIIDTGVEELDQLITVLLSTGMFVGGVLALILDNTIPGTAEERGILTWKEEYSSEDAVDDLVSSVYDFPFGMDAIRRYKWTQYLPFSPTYKGLQLFDGCCKRSKKSNKEQEHANRHAPEVSVED